MTVMWVMKMLADQIINVVAVRHWLVATTWAVNVCRVVLAAVVIGSASNRVLRADRDHMRCCFTVSFLMAHFSVIEIIDVSFMLDLHVPATGTVNVTVFRW
ncbi:MAG: hypothetical protein ACLPXB_01245 [Thiobacillaceae bacterium]